VRARVRCGVMKRWISSLVMVRTIKVHARAMVVVAMALNNKIYGVRTTDTCSDLPFMQIGYVEDDILVCS